MHEYQTMGHILIVAVNPFHAWKIRRQRKNEKNAAPVNLIMGFLFYEYAVIVIAWLALQYGISCNVMGIHISFLYTSIILDKNIIDLRRSNFYLFGNIISFETNISVKPQCTYPGIYSVIGFQFF